MNCANHPDTASVAFCQNCGKPLCSACVRTVQGNIFCEPCLAARVAGASSGFAPGAMPPSPGVPNPGTAAVLGFIPGVGAMYNGQYIKAIVHVLVFVVLIGISEHYGLFGIFIGLWVIYQVFDAHQTAKARRDGLPLPDPFGLNELGNRIGGHTPPPPSGVHGVPPPGAAGPGAGPAGGPPYGEWSEQVRTYAQQWGQQAGEWGEQVRQRIVNEPSRPWGAGTGAGPGAGPASGGPGSGAGSSGYGTSGYGGAGYGVPPAPGAVPPTGAGYAPPPPPPGWAPVPPVPPVPPEMELDRARREPIGAIILILLGMLFLFNTLGFFSFGWISHGWPWVIVGIAVWLLVKNGAGRFRPGMPMAPPPPHAPNPNPPPPTGGAL